MSKDAVALAQMTEMHSALVEELKVQYRNARRAGWLSPGCANQIDRAVRRGTGEAVINGNGEHEPPIPPTQALQMIRAALVKEAGKRTRDADESP